MNEESKPTIDPELEARIVAMVLGEASDFEAEALRQMISEREELAAFESEMLAVDGLLRVATESESIDGGDWKLPADRRASVLEAIGAKANGDDEPPLIRLAKPTHPLLRSRNSWLFASAAAAVLVVIGILSLSVRGVTGQVAAKSEPAWEEGIDFGGERLPSSVLGGVERDFESASILSKSPHVFYSQGTQASNETSERAPREIADTEQPSLYDVDSSRSALSAIRDSLADATPSKTWDNDAKGYFEDTGGQAAAEPQIALGYSAAPKYTVPVPEVADASQPSGVISNRRYSGFAIEEQAKGVASSNAPSDPMLPALVELE